ncbi:MAG: type II secretion system F family protein [Defluviitaleaceae bacterium]|nr:type II secretion system F family protein [Defluviitaleaceae bacterium]
MLFLLIIIFGIGVVALLFYNILFFMATSENEKEVASFEYRRYRDKFLSLQNKYNSDTVLLAELSGFPKTWRKLWHNPKESKKKAIKLKKSMDKLLSGNYNGINFLVLPGFAFLDKIKFNGRKLDATNKLYQRIMNTYTDLLGREHANSNTRYLLSCMIATVLGGIGIGVSAGIFMLTIGNSAGTFIAIGSIFMAFVLAYSLLQGIESKSKAKREEITRDFAQVATEVALLTSAGMEIFKAWDSVCKQPTRKGALYSEMRQTSKEINNGFDIPIAIEGFIRRCATKETAKFGASILQGLERGNAELSRFLAELSKETWEERKRYARTLGEKAKSKLMLPMGLIFLGILLLIGVPMALGMGGVGF